MRTIIICLLLFLLAGCSSSRKLAAHSEHAITDKTITDVRTEQREQTKAQTATATTTTTEEAGEVVTICRVYDTSKSVVISTGKPPLKSETISHKIKNRNTAQHQADSALFERKAERITADNSKYDATTQATTQVEEQRTRHPTGWLWLMIGGAVLLVYKTRGLWMRRG